MITSNETREDFEQFYSGLKELAIDVDIDFEPEFIMQDAAPASFNAAQIVFPNA